MRAFLYADPVAHSLSPVMHAAAFRAASLPGTYEARRVTRGELPAALAALRAPGVLGANLSLPHKAAAARLLDGLSEAAQAIGAVNTVIHQNGRLIGDNTDAPGLLAALQDADAPRGPAVVLGAGGAARAAVYALVGNGRPVWVWNRTLEKAQQLAQDFDTPAAEFHVRAANFGALPWSEIALVVNATSAGLNAPEESPLPTFPSLPEGALVYDMVYKPLETRLVRDARERGLRAESGLGMLAQQARLSFKAWTGVDLDAQVFLNAARAALH